MDYKKYFEMENVTIPLDAKKIINKPNNINITYFENKNEVIFNHSLHNDLGYSKLENGDYLVSSYAFMPNVTNEMINWWFWWHPSQKERYMLWYPGEHFNNSYPKEFKEYFEQTKQPEFIANIQYPVEKIGKMKLPLSIKFEKPEDFGFDKKIMEENNVTTIICGHVGVFNDKIPHTEMAHICFQKEDGILMVSRFWIGKRSKNPLVRKFMLNDKNAIGMAEHCYVEYRNFAKKIPMLYEEYLKEQKN
ncbi:MAG: DAPG hydrolase family protein [Lachnospirales bacterium]